MPEQTPVAAVDKQAIKAEIEATHKAYHELLESLSDEDWKTKSANPAWSVGQLMWHLGRGAEFSVQAVEYCRKGRAPNPPNWLVGPGNVLLTRFGSRGSTRSSSGEKYDQGHTALLACLDGVGDDEWNKGTRIYGNEYTIASAFRIMGGHFREHEQDILKGLGRLT